MLPSGDAKDYYSIMEEEKNRTKSKPILLKALGTGLLGLFALAIFFLLVVRFLGKEGYTKLSSYLSTRYGLWGIALYNYICESFTLPFPTNICFAFMAQMEPWIVIPLLSISGVLGSFTAYAYGRVLDKIPFVKRQSDKILAKWGDQIDRYGYNLILFAGLLPMPFTTICTAAGIVQMQPRKVLPRILIRVLRAILYFYAFRYSFFSLT